MTTSKAYQEWLEKYRPMVVRLLHQAEILSLAMRHQDIHDTAHKVEELRNDAAEWHQSMQAISYDLDGLAVELKEGRANALLMQQGLLELLPAHQLTYRRLRKRFVDFLDRTRLQD